MKLIRTIILLLLILSIRQNAQPSLEKRLSGSYTPSEMITIASNVPYDMAVKMLSTVSQKVSGKTILSGLSDSDPIGLELKNIPYRQALDILVNLKNLTYEENESFVFIRSKEMLNPAAAAAVQPDTAEIINNALNEREVSISAVFFEADVERSREQGIDWKFLLSKKNTSIGLELRTKSQMPGNSGSQYSGNQYIQPGMDISAEVNNIKAGSFRGDATAIFRLFESINLGNIIASPSVTVRNGQKGRIQVGSDFSVKQRDFSGNIIDRFYSAGSIVEVIPQIFRKENFDYIRLRLQVERSTFFPTELTTEIKKTAANTDVLLLDGEETVIGGLYINEEQTIRSGIPILKDLPWWVLGIRYLTGSDQTLIRKKEIVILIRAGLVPALESRVETMATDRLKDKLQEYDNNIRRYNESIPEKSLLKK